MTPVDDHLLVVLFPDLLEAKSLGQNGRRTVLRPPFLQHSIPLKYDLPCHLMIYRFQEIFFPINPMVYLEELLQGVTMLRLTQQMHLKSLKIL